LFRSRPFPSPVRALCQRLAMLLFPEIQSLAFLFLDLTWEIHSAQESSEVARQCHKRNREGFDRQAVARQNSFVTPTRSQVDKKHDPDQQAGSTSKDQVHQENSFEPLPF